MDSNALCQKNEQYHCVKNSIAPQIILTVAANVIKLSKAKLLNVLIFVRIFYHWIITISDVLTCQEII